MLHTKKVFVVVLTMIRIQLTMIRMLFILFYSFIFRIKQLILFLLLIYNKNNYVQQQYSNNKMKRFNFGIKQPFLFNIKLVSSGRERHKKTSQDLTMEKQNSLKQSFKMEDSVFIKILSQTTKMLFCSFLTNKVQLLFFLQRNSGRKRTMYYKLFL